MGFCYTPSALVPALPPATLAQVRTMFPEFAAVPDATVTLFLTLSATFLDPVRWDAMLNIGTLYWVAHKLFTWQQQQGALATGFAATDDVLTANAGGVMYTRDTMLLNAIAKNPFLGDRYGQQYLYYLKLVGVGALAV